MFLTLEFYAGKEIPFESLAKRLTDFGYNRQEACREPGDFAVRGGTVDIFPKHFSLPVRLDFFGETVETIRSFDPATGSPLESHKMVIVLPFKDERRHARGGVASLLDLEDLGRPIDPFVDIETGDYVVHVLHGIGRYRGIRSLKNKEGKTEDHLALEYSDRNLLYVPMHDLHLVQRYISLGRIKPELSNLGTKGWEKLKEKTKKGVLSFAAELLDLQAKRKALQGYRFSKDTEWQKKLEASFPYEETPDQAKAVEAVKKDMEATTPMDRLLCGDVGYGKTEVALRAAFKAVMEGKQVGILVPTTLLAEQHFNTFSERMKDFPVQVRMLSRFQTQSEQAKVVEELKEGTADIVIGTHRLISPDVSFKDLGLVIIDEEQRFGVRHKEHLKRMRLLVDVLTLTATPIPRTLYLSLVGARDFSTIQTPPKGRRPIKTIVTENTDGVVKEALERELARGGQVFFIHNRVQGIEKVLQRVQKLAPKARVAVAHGQMPSRVLEPVMRKFIHGEIDVLVSTTIVESGIDIPNANTLIVDHADAFGLSELYQLRGRVGRFDREAYAYLLVSKGGQQILTEESKKRLLALERFSSLGSGFHIAMEDLEIRGAGNILGTEQHGYIANIGFDLYCRILREAVKSLSPQ